MSLSNAMLDHYRTQSLEKADAGIETTRDFNAATLRAGLKVIFPWMNDTNLLFREQFNNGTLWIVPSGQASEETKAELPGLQEELQKLMEDYLQPTTPTIYTGRDAADVGHIAIPNMTNLAKAINVRAHYLDQCHGRTANDPASLQHQLLQVQAPVKQAEEAIVVRMKPTAVVSKAEVEPLRREGLDLSRILRPRKQENFATTNNKNTPVMRTRDAIDYRKAALNCKALLQAIGKHDASSPTISATRLELVFDANQQVLERSMPVFNGIEKTSVPLPSALKKSFEKLLDKELRLECRLPLHDKESLNRMQQLLTDYLQTSPNKMAILKDTVANTRGR